MTLQLVRQKGHLGLKQIYPRAEFFVMLARAMSDDFKVEPPKDMFYVPSGAKLIKDTGYE